MDNRQPIRLQKFYNLRRVINADWLSRAGIFKKWAYVWCQLNTKSDLIADINFSWATETCFTFLERIFHNKRLCKSLKSSNTIFYSCYSLKYQFAFFCTSLYYPSKWLEFANLFTSFSAPWNSSVPGVAGPSPVIYSGQPTGPNGQPSGRPLFPSAAGKSTFSSYGE